MRLLSLLAAAALVAACSSTPELSDRAQEAFERQDRDRDGVITEADILTAQGERFARADLDGDGFLTEAEFDMLPREVRRGGSLGRGRGQTTVNGFGRMDRDADMRLSPNEYADPALRLFDRGDLDRDGRITREEFVESLQRMRARGGPRGGARDDMRDGTRPRR